MGNIRSIIFDNADRVVVAIDPLRSNTIGNDLADELTKSRRC